MNSSPDAPLAHIPRSLVSAADYAAAAPAHLTEQAWAYFSGGAGDESTLRHNREALDALRLQSRVLSRLDGASTECTLFGVPYAHPILIAPVAYQRLAHVDGEVAMATGASAVGAGMVISTQASMLLEDVAAATQVPSWFQLYMQPDRDHTCQLLARAKQAGCAAIVVTVDAPVNGIRAREHRAGFVLPADVSAVNLVGMQTHASFTAPLGASPLFGSGLLTAAPTWRDLAWLRQQTDLPLLVKGVTAADDARRAIEAGVDGIVVSNHGGRTLDGQPGSAAQLPAVVQVATGQVKILVDGGIQRGTDVLKMLALGADAVCVGRPAVYALAVAGALGVAHVMHILRAELETAMALTGCATLADVGPHVLADAK
ncbi:alpha-hydroxy acid oxidase [Alcaligenaceae bacterium B3P038]|nr:alpha-hydroxy acid oxidase [Alcaligenaceae bacterium B3P038]